jgi:hypothetical protein
MYDLNLNILNKNMKRFHNKDIVDKLEDDLFTKIITKNFTIEDFKLFEDKLKNTQLITDDVKGTYLSALIYFYRLFDSNFYYEKLIYYFDLNLLKIIDTLDFTRHDMIIRKIIKPQEINLEIKKSLLPYLKIKYFDPPPKPSFFKSSPTSKKPVVHWKYKYLKYKQKYLELKKLLEIN